MTAIYGIDRWEPLIPMSTSINNSNRASKVNYFDITLLSTATMRNA